MNKVSIGVFFWAWRRLIFPSIIANRKRHSNPDRQINKPQEIVGSTAHPVTREAASACMGGYNLTTYLGALPPEGAEFHTRKAPGVMAARPNGRDTDKPNAWSMLVPSHQARTKLQPFSNTTPMGDVEGIREGRGALQQRQGKPVSVEWVGPFSGAGMPKVTYANRPSKHLSPPSAESRVHHVCAKPTYPETYQ